MIPMPAGPATETYHDGDSTPIVTSISTVPVTVQRPVWTTHNQVHEAGIARANIAATEARPNGTTEDNYAKKHSHETVLQQHVEFFDLNGDGVITPFETWVGFRLIGWNIFLTLVAVIVIHSGFSYVTQPSWIPDPLFRIYAKNIHKGKHGSDSNTYDHEGRFVPQSLEDFFSKYGSKRKVAGRSEGEWGMTYRQALMGVRGQMCVMDFFGVFAATFEWTATYITIWPADGIMRMEDVRGCYDGSYFYKLRDSRDEKKLK
ncbi:Caleosin-domain-containing protein [Panus rudis PR-1116 ss-1]|nr:Caleosin-domain-containing protein [Panus rudis PR-1116 ss-1]